MKLYKIRVTAEVQETAHETRHVNVDSHVLTFGRQPAYIRAVKLPPQLADDPYLRIEAVDSPPLGVPIIDLKSERVQEPAAETLPGPETDLKSERVQEPTAEAFPGDETDLKSERVQEPTGADGCRRSGHVGPEAQVIPDLSSASNLAHLPGVFLCAGRAFRQEVQMQVNLSLSPGYRLKITRASRMSELVDRAITALAALGGSAAFLEILRRWLQRRQEKRQEQLQLDVRILEEGHALRQEAYQREREALQALAEERERRRKAELAALEAQMQAKLEALTRANEAISRELDRAKTLLSRRVSAGPWLGECGRSYWLAFTEPLREKMGPAERVTRAEPWPFALLPPAWLS